MRADSGHTLWQWDKNNSVDVSAKVASECVRRDKVKREDGDVFMMLD